MKRGFARYLEVTLLAIGLTLLAVFLAFRVHGGIASRIAVRGFTRAASQDATGAGARIQTAEQDVDFGLWSRARIEAYKQSLGAAFDAPIALLTIPRLSLKVPVFEGTEESVLNRGVGRIIDTAKPGDDGNIGIAGHRDGFFRTLKDIRAGDRIELTTRTQVITYVVDGIEIVVPGDVSVLAPRDRPSVTLVTCYPFYFVGSAPQRFIVHASVVESAHENNAPRHSEVEMRRRQEARK